MNYKTFYKAVLLFSLFAAVTAGIFMTVSIFHCADESGINMYSSDNVEYYGPVNLILIICAAGYIAATAVFRKRLGKKVDFSATPSRIVYSIMGFLLAALFVFCLCREFFAGEGYDHGNMYVLFTKEIAGGVESSKVSVLYLVFLLLLAGSFVFYLYGANKKNLDADGSVSGSETFAVMSMLPSAAMAIKIIYDFLLQSGNGYGTLYNYHLIGMGFTLLFTVYESRFYFKKAMPSLYFLFGLVAASASLVFSIPALVLFFAGKAGANWHPVFCAADIFIVICIYVRLFSLNVHQYERQKKQKCIEDGDNAPANIVNVDEQ